MRTAISENGISRRKLFVNSAGIAAVAGIPITMSGIENNDLAPAAPAANDNNKPGKTIYEHDHD